MSEQDAGGTRWQFSGADIGHYARQTWAFLRYLRERFEQDRCSRAAASLAYTTLLALVPLFTVVFVTLSAFPAFKAWSSAIESFIFDNFVPALGVQIRDYLVQFSSKAKGLQAAGTVFLVATVLMMMSTIESTFNVIWRIRRKRPLMVRFLVYWSVLTLGPILIGAGMVATSYVISLPLLSDAGVTDGLRTRIIGAFPLLATTAAFVMFFKLIPYRPVPTRHALIGGIFASVLFEFAKRGFALYVTNFPSHQAVYGAFATVPIFLIWIYLSWVIVLLGAEITQCLATYRFAPRWQNAQAVNSSRTLCGFRVLYRLYSAQLEGRGLSEKQLMRLEPGFGYHAINDALELLDGAGWISRNEAFQWVLMRDLNRLNLLDFLQLAPTLGGGEIMTGAAPDSAGLRLNKKLAELREFAEGSLTTPLAELMASDRPAAASAVTPIGRGGQV